MKISLTQAREMQQIVRTDPRRAPAIVGDLIAALNSAAPTNSTRAHDATLFDIESMVNVGHRAVKSTETAEQCEQRLLDELDSVRKAKEEAAAVAKVEEAKNVRIDAIHRAVDLSQATTDVLKAIFGQLHYNTGDVVSRDTWWKFRKELAPVVAAHGFKLVNVGTKSKPKAALAEA